MAQKDVGEVRRSQIVMTYGPGSIMNLKSGNASISIIMGDPKSWAYESTGEGTVAKKQTIIDSRLSKSIKEKYAIKIDKFKLAPVEVQNKRSGYETENHNKANLVGAIFPRMMMCRKCRSIKHLDDWEVEDKSVRRWCANSECTPNHRNHSYVLPSRFVTACQNGHIDEFPYAEWLRHNGKHFEKNEPIDNSCNHTNMALHQRKGLGLSSLILSCKECKGWTSLAGIFSKDGLRFMKCTGRKPWKVDEDTDVDNECNAPLKAQQRNSKTLWQPIPMTAIYVPPWDDKTAMQLQHNDWWIRIISRTSSEDRLRYIEFNLEDINPECKTQFTAEELHEKVETELDNDKKSNVDLKIDEYKALTNNISSIDLEHFKLRPKVVPDNILQFVKQVSEITKLREVRALIGFRRLNGLNPQTGIGKDVLYDENNWLPATEVFGEGLFIEFDLELIYNFIKNDPQAINDFKKIKADLSDIDKKYVFLHSLSHIVMKGASIEAGYSLSSIRERVYAGENQCGILIYTSASDSEGTLGGLSRLAKPERMSKIFKHSYLNAAKCSNDPLCAHGTLSESEDQNGSICHSCLLLPETTCENFNSRLSRVMVEKFLHIYNIHT